MDKFSSDFLSVQVEQAGVLATKSRPEAFLRSDLVENLTDEDYSLLKAYSGVTYTPVIIIKVNVAPDTQITKLAVSTLYGNKKTPQKTKDKKKGNDQEGAVNWQRNHQVFEQVSKKNTISGLENAPAVNDPSKPIPFETITVDEDGALVRYAFLQPAANGPQKRHLGYQDFKIEKIDFTDEAGQNYSIDLHEIKGKEQLINKSDGMNHKSNHIKLSQLKALGTAWAPDEELPKPAKPVKKMSLKKKLGITVAFAAAAAVVYGGGLYYKKRQEYNAHVSSGKQRAEVLIGSQKEDQKAPKFIKVERPKNVKTRVSNTTLEKV